MTTKTTESRREAFEAFAIEAFGPGSLELDGNGDYFWESTRNAFDVWRAALDSLCVELPERPEYECTEGSRDQFRCGQRRMLTACQAALTAAGVPYK